MGAVCHHHRITADLLKPPLPQGVFKSLPQLLWRYVIPPLQLSNTLQRKTGIFHLKGPRQCNTDPQPGAIVKKRAFRIRLPDTDLIQTNLRHGGIFLSACALQTFLHRLFFLAHHHWNLLLYDSRLFHGYLL